MRLIQLVTGLALTLLAAVATATPVTSGSLQTDLDAISQQYVGGVLQTGGTFLDVNSDQYSPDESWEMTSTGGSISFLLGASVSGAEFGIYDLADSSKQLALYDSSNSVNDTVTLVKDVNSPTDVKYTVTAPTPPPCPFGVCGSSPVRATDDAGGPGNFSSEQFGFYLISGGSTFFSQSGLNGGDDHMIAFNGNFTTPPENGIKLDADGDGDYEAFQAGEFVLAFDDSADGAGDFDDFVVFMESVDSVTVPEPSALLLLGLGIFGLGLIPRSKTKAV